jgi:RimJ/RimL family protein N-acetyltransferase
VTLGPRPAGRYALDFARSRHANPSRGPVSFSSDRHKIVGVVAMTDERPQPRTARLILRPLELPDAEAVSAIFLQWDIVRYLTDEAPCPCPADEARTFLRDVAPPPMWLGSALHWSIRLRANPDRLIGSVSLRDQRAQNRDLWLDSAWQGRGYMVEASGAATDYWFELLDRPLLRIQKPRRTNGPGGSPTVPAWA